MATLNKTRTKYKTADANISIGDIAYVRKSGEVTSNAVNDFSLSVGSLPSLLSNYNILNSIVLGSDTHLLCESGGEYSLIKNESVVTVLGTYDNVQIKLYDGVIYVVTLLNGKINVLTTTDGLNTTTVWSNITTKIGLYFDFCLCHSDLYLLYNDTRRDYPSLASVDMNTGTISSSYILNSEKSNKIFVSATDDGIVCVYNDLKNSKIIFNMVYNFKIKFTKVISDNTTNFKAIKSGDNFVVSYNNQENHILSSVLLYTKGNISISDTIITNKFSDNFDIVECNNAFCLVISQQNYNTLLFYSIDNKELALTDTETFISTENIKSVSNQVNNDFKIYTPTQSILVTAETNTFIGIVQQKDNDDITVASTGQISSVHTGLTIGAPFIINGTQRDKAISETEILIS